jgi:hypothetical protein
MRTAATMRDSSSRSATRLARPGSVALLAGVSGFLLGAYAMKHTRGMASLATRLGGVAERHRGARARLAPRVEPGGPDESDAAFPDGYQPPSQAEGDRETVEESLRSHAERDAVRGT